MSTGHEERPFCYLCGKYFGTKKFLKTHYKTTQKEFKDMTESEGEENNQLTKDIKKAKKKKRKTKK